MILAGAGAGSKEVGAGGIPVLGCIRRGSNILMRLPAFVNGLVKCWNDKGRCWGVCQHASLREALC